MQTCDPPFEEPPTPRLSPHAAPDTRAGEARTDETRRARGVCARVHWQRYEVRVVVSGRL
eukprot:2178081-Rhodomonas_salina.1